MSKTITFYHHPMTRARTVHWMLEEIGQPYELKILDLQKGEHKQPAYLAINPMGKVPAIVHGDTVVTETAAICAYLADTFPAAKLAPALDDPARGTYLRWFFFGAGCLDAAIMDRAMGRPKAEKTTSLGYGTFEDTVAAVEKAIAPGPFILGTRFSAVDVYISSLLGTGMILKALEPRPSFQAYIARCDDREAFKRFREKSKALADQLKAKG